MIMNDDDFYLKAATRLAFCTVYVYIWDCGSESESVFDDNREKKREIGKCREESELIMRDEIRSVY